MEQHSVSVLANKSSLPPEDTPMSPSVASLAEIPEDKAHLGTEATARPRARCIPRYVLRVVKRLKYLFNPVATSQSIVQIVTVKRTVQVDSNYQQ